MNKFLATLRDAVTPLMVFGLVAVVAYDHLAPKPPVPSPNAVDGRAAGRKFAATMPATFADAWLAAAEALDAGKSIADAQAALQTAWQAGRSQSFEALVAAEFAKVLPEGAEPATPAQRAAVAQLWRDFAAGLKGGR